MYEVNVDAAELIAWGKRAGLSLGNIPRATRAAAWPIVRAARAKTPTRSGALRRSIRPVRSRSAVRVRTHVAYAAPVHWGRDGRSGPNFLYNAVPVALPAVLTILDREINRQIGELK